eukprot:TRINITY_DN39855_c0_g1_i4.p4 TRINITY_DN39855_c0_g1~~TRINITY_DN39855_c0_g1_i4.p4  ORF type:complete len:211 (-),score=4.29 TRINITY_DN39855_c0_g1_i4:2994-3626(-)
MCSVGVNESGSPYGRQNKSPRQRRSSGQQTGAGGKRSSSKNSSKLHSRTRSSTGNVQGQSQPQFQYRALLPTVPENTEYRHKRDFKPLYVKLPVVTNRNPQYTSIRQCLRSYEQWLNVRFPGYDRPVTSANMMRLLFTHPKLFFDLSTACFKKPPSVRIQALKGQGQGQVMKKCCDVPAESEKDLDRSKLASFQYTRGYGLASTMSVKSA